MKLWEADLFRHVIVLDGKIKTNFQKEDGGQIGTNLNNVLALWNTISTEYKESDPSNG